jgi:hypothetical protein
MARVTSLSKLQGHVSCAGPSGYVRELLRGAEGAGDVVPGGVLGMAAWEMQDDAADRAGDARADDASPPAVLPGAAVVSAGHRRGSRARLSAGSET